MTYPIQDTEIGLSPLLPYPVSLRYLQEKRKLLSRLFVITSAECHSYSEQIKHIDMKIEEYHEGTH